MLKYSYFLILFFVCHAFAELNIISREEWHAKPAKEELAALQTPVDRIIIAHTAANECKTKDVCIQEILNIQNSHMNKFNFDDIAYNFLIGSDGNVYEGRGSGYQSDIATTFKVDSISIGYMGIFMTNLPSRAALDAGKELVAKLKSDMKLNENYQIYGHKQVSPTVSPGDALYVEIQKWPKWSIESKGQDNVSVANVLRIVSRIEWLAQPPIDPWVKLNLPVKHVVIMPTRTSNCETQAACIYSVRFTQTFNIEAQQQNDIIYNFMIGGDGNVYEGLGWDNRGSDILGYNDDSITVAFIGSFHKNKPSDKQMNITRLLLEEGVRLGKITMDYKIVGLNEQDPASTTTAGDA